MKTLIVTLALAAIALTGCATPKQWEATGGSKTDGIVQVSYELGQFESGQTSAAQGLATAENRCKTWGYKSAEITGSEKNICRTMGQYNCLQTTITQDYECRR
ncbi:YecR-like lipofamily protein [Pseudomonas sp. B2M1-30]|uniref:YecR-like lipofamily protein n=1 Tax=Pseudomonas TaxID=286 RepID=UPI0021C8E383|nr:MULTISPECIES: YecR-like lipofamily protein [Pseudomonas]MCU0120863.1 YecR-like lipofamily protein [Pseudomonas sp. B2M1-30]MCU7259948.1 YecR-like lipofamily protein [Pseudomonas koreensis]